MIPAGAVFTIRQGDTFSYLLKLSNPAVPAGSGTPVDLTGASAQMQIRTPGSATPQYTLKSSAATANGGAIALGGTLGTVTVTIPPADTLSLVSGVYDLRVQFPNGSIATYLAGGVTVEPQVTIWA